MTAQDLKRGLAKATTPDEIREIALEASRQSAEILNKPWTSSAWEAESERLLKPLRRALRMATVRMEAIGADPRDVLGPGALSRAGLAEQEQH